MKIKHITIVQQISINKRRLTKKEIENNDKNGDKKETRNLRTQIILNGS